MRIACKHCDCTLWSLRSRELKVCPECEGVDDEIESLDLEDQLEKLLN